MKTTKKITISIDFTPEEYFLVREIEKEPFGGGTKWYLGYKCDRSDKGKEPELGATRIYLEGDEIEECKKWFDIVEL